MCNVTTRLLVYVPAGRSDCSVCVPYPPNTGGKSKINQGGDQRSTVPLQYLGGVNKIKPFCIEPLTTVVPFVPFRFGQILVQ